MRGQPGEGKAKGRGRRDGSFKRSAGAGPGGGGAVCGTRAEPETISGMRGRGGHVGGRERGRGGRSPTHQARPSGAQPGAPTRGGAGTGQLPLQKVRGREGNQK